MGRRVSNASAGLGRADQLIIDGATSVIIWVANGEYFADRDHTDLDGSGDRTDKFHLKAGVKLYAGFQGQSHPSGGEPNSETGFLSRDPFVNITTLSGNIGDPNTFADNTHHIIYYQQPITGGNAVVDGFTITFGNAAGSAIAPGGGAVVVFQTALQGASPWFDRCRFEFNQGAQGGAVHINAQQGSHPRFRNCIFSNNDSVSGGTQLGEALFASNVEGCVEPPPSISQSPGPAVHLHNCLVNDNGPENQTVASEILPADQMDRIASSMSMTCLR